MGRDMQKSDPQPTDRVIGSISENHRRRINAALGLIDQALGRWAQYAAGAEGIGLLLHLRNDLTANQRQALARLIEQTRELVTELSRGLDLKTQTRTVRSILPGECGILWETVAGLDPRHLQAWGGTEPEFDAYWEPRRQMLEDLLDRVLKVVADTP